jgi:hypothetical protein
VGSIAVGGALAQLAFCILVGWGYFSGELRLRGVAIAIALWLAGNFGLPYLTYRATLITTYVAVLDIGLVFVIFRGDVRLT